MINIASAIDHSIRSVSKFMKDNRIYFSEGNPWPEGHAIKSLFLDARLYDDDLLRVTMHLETEDYYENDNREFIDDDEESDVEDWASKTVWNNYHACSIDGALLESDGSSLISLDSLARSIIQIDQLPEALNRANEDELTFNIYLLGHDDVADHTIELGALENNSYPIKWSGKVALSYSGDYEFKYGFTLSGLLNRLERIWYPDEWSDAKAIETLAKMLKEHEKFKIGEIDGRKAFVLTN